VQPESEHLPLLTPAGAYLLFDVHQPNASTIRAHWGAVREALAGNSEDARAPYAGIRIHDRAGPRYALLTDPDRLHAFFGQLAQDEYQSLSRIIGAALPEG
jgi:hypothetical protein